MGQEGLDLHNILSGTESTEDRIFAALYGVGNSGKSTTAVNWPEEWGTGTYIAAEGTSKRLRSIPAALRRRMFIYKTTGYEVRNAERELERTEWQEEGFDLAQRDWPKWIHDVACPQLDQVGRTEAAEHLRNVIVPNHGVVVWDGGSSTAEKVLEESVLKQWFSAKHPTSGEKSPDVNYGKKIGIPQPGDFNVAQSIVNRMIEFLADVQVAELGNHCIVTFQESLQRADDEKHRNLAFGPLSVGQAGPRQIPNRFDIVLALSRDFDPGAENPSSVLVRQYPSDNYVCGIKGPDGLTRTDVELYRRLSSAEDIVNMWRDLVKLGEI